MSLFLGRQRCGMRRIATSASRVASRACSPGQHAGQHGSGASRPAAHRRRVQQRSLRIRFSHDVQHTGRGASAAREQAASTQHAAYADGCVARRTRSRLGVSRIAPAPAPAGDEREQEAQHAAQGPAFSALPRLHRALIRRVQRGCSAAKHSQAPHFGERAPHGGARNRQPRHRGLAGAATRPGARAETPLCPSTARLAGDGREAGGTSQTSALRSLCCSCACLEAACAASELGSGSPRTAALGAGGAAPEPRRRRAGRRPARAPPCG